MSVKFEKISGANGAQEYDPLEGVPQHVAIIMDGNGRWAKFRRLPRVEGHRAGVKTVRMVVEESRRIGVRYLTLFAFSTENWNRPKDEVSSLMGLFASYLRSELAELMQNGIRLRAIGDLERLPGQVRDALYAAQEQSRDRNGMDLILAVSYGGRAEIVGAARKICEKVVAGALQLSSIDENAFQQHLFASDIPDPDLLIRTSDVSRISNFLLWQLAYAEIVVSPLLWPDFSKEEFLRCIREFSLRERRFGLTADQARELFQASGT